MIFNTLCFTTMITCALYFFCSCSKFEQEEAKIIINDIEKIIEMQDESAE